LYCKETTLRTTKPAKRGHETRTELPAASETNSILQRQLFQTELVHLVDERHPLVRLAGEIDWAAFDEAFGVAYADSNVGRPPAPTRLLVALHDLKYTFDLSDENVILRWLENPYWQYFSGEKFFQHEPPIDSSSMTRWRNRVGEAGAEELLRETIQAGLRLNLIKASQLARVNVDTTVMETGVRQPLGTATA